MISIFEKMKFFVISDSTDSVVGMRLAGIEGVTAQTSDETAAALERAYADPEIGVILITEHLSAACGDIVSEMKMSHTRPLIVEIPDRDGGGRAADSITRYVRESIGLKL